MTVKFFKKYYSLSSDRILKYFISLTVSYHNIPSLLGFIVFLIIVNQIWSGIMLALSLVNDPMLIPSVREEEDLENLYIDDFFWLHQRGVDFLFVFIALHFFRKLYMSAYTFEKADSWKTGVFAFLIIFAIVFTGLTLCVTHLSEVTAVIATNIFRTFFNFIGNIHWLIFTDGTLNSDTIIRLSYLHYILGCMISLIGLIHGIDMHYDWQPNSETESIPQELNWVDEAVKSELQTMLYSMALFVLWLEYFISTHNPATGYEIFTWGDVGMSVDVRFYGVAPHWYFRPFMAWLISCPHHYIGIFGLVYFFLVLFFQPEIAGGNEILIKKLHSAGFIFFLNNRTDAYLTVWEKSDNNTSYFWQLTFWFFLMAILYVGSYLPYGRFYHGINGNYMTEFSFAYIYLFLTFSSLRQSWYTSLARLNTLN